MHRKLIRLSFLLVAVVVSCLWWVRPAVAYPFYMDPSLTIPGDVEEDFFSENRLLHILWDAPTPGPFQCTFADLKDFVPHPPNGFIDPPADPGGDNPFSGTSFFDVFVELDLNGTDYAANGVGQMLVSTDHNVLPDTTVFQTEMLQLDISGGTLPAGMMIRESPTLQSTGQATVTNIGGGVYQIDSFFDVFTELSVDGGQTWTPADSPMSFVGTPEPSSIALLGIGATILMVMRRHRRRSQ